MHEDVRIHEERCKFLGKKKNHNKLFRSCFNLKRSKHSLQKMHLRIQITYFYGQIHIRDHLKAAMTFTIRRELNTEREREQQQEKQTERSKGESII